MKTKKHLTIALAGNPNAGKTTIFNNLTGARQSVGNYPGVTVEKKEGLCRFGDVEVTVVDLPGTYSLTAYSVEEVLARNFIVDEKPDVVVDVIDASNLERNLYLAVQLMELGVPLVLVFNMSDVARARGVEFDLAKLSALLEAPIIPCVGNKGKGMEELLATVLEVSEKGQTRKLPVVHYGPEIEKAIVETQETLARHPEFGDPRRARWTAVKLLENDREVARKLTDPEVATIVAKDAARLGALLGESPEMVMAGRRYGFISGACQEAVCRTAEAWHKMSDRIDAVVTNRVVGLPLFLGLMYLVFFLTFSVGSYPMAWLEHLFGWLGGSISSCWPEGTDSLLRSLLVDGIIGGVGGVLVFLPNIMLLFLAIAILEDSGYMARAAFIMDDLMHYIGLHGKSFIPMLIGFGCSVPAIMATRTIDNRRDQLTTMLVLPLISCGARLTIYTLIIPAFFPPTWHAPMLWLIYVIGIVFAVLCAKFLRSTLFKGETAPFVMELPPYRVPTLRSVFLHMWDRSAAYLRKAGTIILGFAVVLWALTTFPRLPAAGPDVSPVDRRAMELEHTVAGRVGRTLEPVLRPMGFDWRIGTSLIGALGAKEIFVTQLGIVFAVGDPEGKADTLRQKLRDNYSPLVGFCIMLFTLISAPCVATLAVTRKESGSWKWALFQFGGLTGLAYVITTIVYQVGRVLGG